MTGNDHNTSHIPVYYNITPRIFLLENLMPQYIPTLTSVSAEQSQFHRSNQTAHKTEFHTAISVLQCDSGFTTYSEIFELYVS